MVVPELAEDVGASKRLLRGRRCVIISCLGWVSRRWTVPLKETHEAPNISKKLLITWDTLNRGKST
jgi:hypothetical protein